MNPSVFLVIISVTLAWKAIDDAFFKLREWGGSWQMQTCVRGYQSSKTLGNRALQLGWSHPLNHPLNKHIPRPSFGPSMVVDWEMFSKIRKMNLTLPSIFLLFQGLRRFFKISNKVFQHNWQRLTQLPHVRWTIHEWTKIPLCRRTEKGLLLRFCSKLPFLWLLGNISH
jgi:hypothetical protein